MTSPLLLLLLLTMIRFQCFLLLLFKDLVPFPPVHVPRLQHAGVACFEHCCKLGVDVLVVVISDWLAPGVDPFLDVSQRL